MAQARAKLDETNQRIADQGYRPNDAILEALADLNCGKPYEITAQQGTEEYTLEFREGEFYFQGTFTSLDDYGEPIRYIFQTKDLDKDGYFKGVRTTTLKEDGKIPDEIPERSVKNAFFYLGGMFDMEGMNQSIIDTDLEFSTAYTIGMVALYRENQEMKKGCE